MPLNLLHSNDRHGKYPASWYAATANQTLTFDQLDHDTQADVCVIGGGFTGLSTALHLAEAGVDVVLVEAQRVGWGASGRNGGQVGAGLNTDLQTLERKIGASHAAKVWDLARDARNLVSQLVDRHSIDCDLRPGVVSVFSKARHFPEAKAATAYLQQRYDNAALQILDRNATRALVNSPLYCCGVLDRDSAHLHPLNYALGLAKAAQDAGARIFEQAEVTGIEAGDRIKIRTSAGTVTAPHLVLACNGYLGDLSPQVARRVMPINNFIVATEPLGLAAAEDLIAQDVAVADDRFVVNYYRRSADHRMLFGGGESYGYKFPSDISALVRKPMTAVFPQLADVKIDFAWGGTLAITMSREPCFLKLGPNIFSASGYSGHGVALATLAGKLLAGATRGSNDGFDTFAALPQSTFPGGPIARQPLLVLAMTWFALRDRLGW